MSEEANLAESNGYFLVLEMLIKRLDRAGLLSAGDFSLELETEARLIEESWAGAYAPGTPRRDVKLLLALASAIKRDYDLGVEFGQRVGVDAAAPTNGDE